MTTDTEYGGVLNDQSDAQQRRWEVMRLIEFTRQETVAVLQGMAKEQYRDHNLATETLQAVAILAHKYIRPSPNPFDPTQVGTQPDVSVSLLGEFIQDCKHCKKQPTFENLIDYFCSIQTGEHRTNLALTRYVREQIEDDKHAAHLLKDCFIEYNPSGKGGPAEGKEELITHFRKNPTNLLVCGNSPYLFYEMLAGATSKLDSDTLDFYTFDFAKFVQYANDSSTSDNLLDQLEQLLKKATERERKPVLIISDWEQLFTYLSDDEPPLQRVSDITDAAQGAALQMGIPQSWVQAVGSVSKAAADNLPPQKSKPKPSRPLKLLLNQIKQKAVFFVGVSDPASPSLNSFKEEWGTVIRQPELKTTDILSYLTSWSAGLSPKYEPEGGLVRIAYHLALHFCPDKPNPDMAITLIERTLRDLPHPNGVATKVTKEDLVNAVSQLLNQPHVQVEAVAAQAAIWTKDLVPQVLPFKNTTGSSKQREVLRILAEEEGVSPVVYVWEESPLRTELFLKAFEKQPQGWTLHQLDIRTIKKSGTNDSVAAKSIEASLDKLMAGKGKIALWVTHDPLLERPNVQNKLAALINTGRATLFYGCKPTQFAFPLIKQKTKTSEMPSDGSLASTILSQFTGNSNPLEALSQIVQSVQGTLSEKKEEAPLPPPPFFPSNYRALSLNPLSASELEGYVRERFSKVDQSDKEAITTLSKLLCNRRIPAEEAEENVSAVIGEWDANTSPVLTAASVYDTLTDTWKIDKEDLMDEVDRSLTTWSSKVKRYAAWMNREAYRTFRPLLSSYVGTTASWLITAFVLNRLYRFTTSQIGKFLN